MDIDKLAREAAEKIAETLTVTQLELAKLALRLPDPGHDHGGEQALDKVAAVISEVFEEAEKRSVDAAQNPSTVPTERAAETAGSVSGFERLWQEFAGVAGDNTLAGWPELKEFCWHLYRCARADSAIVTTEGDAVILTMDDITAITISRALKVFSASLYSGDQAGRIQRGRADYIRTHIDESIRALATNPATPSSEASG